MLRLHALTLVSALLLALSVFPALPLVNALQPFSDHRMIKRYKHLQHRQILDDVFGNDAGPSGSPSGASQSGSATATRSTGGGGIIGGIGSAIGGGDPSSTTTTTSTTTEESTPTLSTTSTRSSPSPTRAPTTQEQSSSTTSTPQTTVTRLVYEDATPEQKAEIESNRQHQSTLSRIPDNVRVILIVVASVLAGLIIIWTAVRKWKLRSSRSFQSRLAPIDWQPDNDKDKLTPPPAMSEISDKDSIRRNMFAPDGPSLAPPPHDFTAGTYSRSASPMPNPYARAGSPAPAAALQRYPSNGSGRAGGYDPRGY